MPLALQSVHIYTTGTAIPNHQPTYDLAKRPLKIEELARMEKPHAQQSRPGPGGLSIGRLETFVDGVFAVVITLLILDIRVPQVEGEAVGAKLLQEIINMWPKYFAYAISFVIVGVYWVGHHAQFRFIRHANRTLLWINILFLMCVAFVPFSAALIGEYRHEQIAVVIYGVNLIVVGGCLYLHYWYATQNHRLVDADLSAQQIETSKRRILMAPMICLVAIGLSFVSTTLSIILYLLLPIPYILPGRIDIHWSRSHHTVTQTHPASGEEPTSTPQG